VESVCIFFRIPVINRDMFVLSVLFLTVILDVIAYSMHGLQLINEEEHPSGIPIIDIQTLVENDVRDNQFCAHTSDVSLRMLNASMDVGFFYIRNHGVSVELQEDLMHVARAFFRLERTEKEKISMEKGGSAWRGFFAVGDEVTSGIPDQKEGIYFGTETSNVDTKNGKKPLHGSNLFPDGELGKEMREKVLEYMREMSTLGQKLMRTIACSFESLAASSEELAFQDGADSCNGINNGHSSMHVNRSVDPRFPGGMRAVVQSMLPEFTRQFLKPTELFRIFNYPPHDGFRYGEDSLGVGEHTDYGYLTILKQDSSGGLQVKDMGYIRTGSRDNDTSSDIGDVAEGDRGQWIDAIPVPNTFVVNLGDALEHATGGLIQATPHRVLQRVNASGDRLSMPYFFDPCFDCPMVKLIDPRGKVCITSDTVPMQNDAKCQGASSHASSTYSITGTAADSNVLSPTSSSGTTTTSRSSSSSSSSSGSSSSSSSSSSNSFAVDPQCGDSSKTSINNNDNNNDYNNITRRRKRRRWDNADPTLYEGTYGSYLLKKVSRAFPALFERYIVE